MTQCVVGILASVAAFLIGFVPPSQFSSSSPVVYGLLILAGIVALGVLPPLLLYRFRKASWKLTPVTAGGASPKPAGTATSATASNGRGAGSKASQGASAAVAPAPADTAETGEGTRHGRSRLYWGIAAAVVALAVAGLLIFKQGPDNSDARKKADQVVSLFAAHHLVVPVDHKTLIDVLGDDGGPVCADPSGALIKALQDEQLSNGAATVGSRPIRVDRQVVYGEELVVSVYCPQKLAALHTYVNAKSYYKVIRN